MEVANVAVRVAVTGLEDVDDKGITADTGVEP
jgi:hypothetical protein